MTIEWAINFSSLSLNPHILLYSKSSSAETVFINTLDNTLITLRDFHAVCMEYILENKDLEEAVINLMNLYQIDQKTCQKEILSFVSYLLDKKIIDKKKRQT